MADKPKKLYLVTIEMMVEAESGADAENLAVFLLGDQSVESITVEPHPGFEDGDE